MSNENTARQCQHCRGEKYVLLYWFEKFLDLYDVHMTELPPEFFVKIPVLEFLRYCHCHVGVRLALTRQYDPFCMECEGTTWRFTELAEQSGYQWKKVINLAGDEILSLPCEYFERCPCREDEQLFKQPKRQKLFSGAPSILKQLIPAFSFG